MVMLMLKWGSLVLRRRSLLIWVVPVGWGSSRRDLCLVLQVVLGVVMLVSDWWHRRKSLRLTWWWGMSHDIACLLVNVGWWLVSDGLGCMQDLVERFEPGLMSSLGIVKLFLRRWRKIHLWLWQLWWSLWWYLWWRMFLMEFRLWWYLWWYCWWWKLLGGGCRWWKLML